MSKHTDYIDETLSMIAALSCYERHLKNIFVIMTEMEDIRPPKQNIIDWFKKEISKVEFLHDTYNKRLESGIQSNESGIERKYPTETIVD